MKSKQPPGTVRSNGFKGTTTRHIAKDTHELDIPEVPVIDCAAVFSEKKQERLMLTKEIKEALLQYHCFYATNIRMTKELWDEVLESLDTFFSLSLQEKMRVHNSQSIARRGYQYFLEEKGGKELKDMREAFRMVADPQNEDCNFSGAASPISAGNLWPQQPKDFQSNLYHYQSVMHRFSTRLMGVLALAMGAPEDYFSGRISEFPGTSALYYPLAEQRTDFCGRDVHTDYSWITLIDQINQVPGLEVLLPSGRWTLISPIPNTVVLVAGDFLERVSNDNIASTVHRVLNHPDKKRYSLAFFLDADPNASIEVLESCVSKLNPQKYTNVKAFEWQNELWFRPSALSSNRHSESRVTGRR